jgi:putative protein-disulfide isomerase
MTPDAVKNPPRRLTYVFDAYCGWCYGFGPAFAALAAHVEDSADIEIISGGLFAGARRGPIGNFGHIRAANRRIHELTGVTFGPSYEALLDGGQFMLDSTDAAAGLLALMEEGPTLAVAFVEDVQRAFYQDGRSLSDPGTYDLIAQRYGLPGEAVAKRSRSPQMRAKAEAGFERARALGVDSYPTLMLTTGDQTVRFAGPRLVPAELIAQYEALIAG